MNAAKTRRGFNHISRFSLTTKEPKLRRYI